VSCVISGGESIMRHTIPGSMPSGDSREYFAKQLLTTQKPLSARQVKRGTRLKSVILLAFVLVAVLAAIAIPALAAPPVAGALESVNVSDIKVSDPDTIDIVQQRIWDDPSGGGDTSILNGRIWTDKTVNKDVTNLPFHSDTYAGNTNIPGAANPYQAVDTSKSLNFGVTLSAMSQGYDVKVVTTPSDVVFILDVSGSMVSNNLGSQTRAAVMVDALNVAIEQLMAANPYNRLAVVAFGGTQSGNNYITRQQVILPLGRYDNTQADGLGTAISGKIFSINGSTITVNPKVIPLGPAFGGTIPSTFKVEGGTPTQLGIAAGANVLASVPNTVGSTIPTSESGTIFYDEITDSEHVRRPNIILLSDGDPTYAWNAYDADPSAYGTSSWNHGNGSASDMGMDVLCVMTASYWKQKVNDNYNGAGSSMATTFYTIGVGVSGSHAPTVLNPEVNAPSDTNSRGENAATILEDWVNTPPVQFYAVGTNGSTLSQVPAINNTGNYVASYYYADGFYDAQNASDLNDAFQNIASSIITTGGYMTDIPDNSDPNFAGNLILKDVLGVGMEFKAKHGFYFNDKVFRGNLLAGALTNQGSDTPANNATNTTKFLEVLEGRLGIDQAAAQALLDSCKAGKTVYYNSDTDYGTEIKYYANSGLGFVGNYFNADGSVATPPADAECIASIHSIQGEETNPVSGQETDLRYLFFGVVEALSDGTFSAPLMGGHQTFTLKAKQQCMLWYIPASLLPMRTVKPVYTDPNDKTTIDHIEITEVDPIRAVYTVGVRTDIADLIKSGAVVVNSLNIDGEHYTIYTNDYSVASFGGAGKSDAMFDPSRTNPYFYYTGDSDIESPFDGTTRLFVAVDTGTRSLDPNYVEASAPIDTSGVTTYYTIQEVFDTNNPPTYLSYNFEEVSADALAALTPDDITTNAKGTPAIAYGVAKVLDVESVAKTSNPTNTLPNVVSSGKVLIGITQEQVLGNNGTLDLYLTQVPARKVWTGNGLKEDIWIQLYGYDPSVEATLPLGTPFYVPKGATGTSLSTVFKSLSAFFLSPDENGDMPLYNYSIREGSYKNGIFTPWGNPGGANKTLTITIQQPTWDDVNGVWTEGVVTNFSAVSPHVPGVDPVTPPVTPPPTPPVTPPPTTVTPPRPPVTPSNPGNPGNPGNPRDPQGARPMPRTGDESKLLFWSLMLLTSAGAVLAILRKSATEKLLKEVASLPKK